MRRALQACASWYSSAWTRVPAWFLALYRHPLTFLGLILTIPLVAVCGWIAIANEPQWRTREAEDLMVAARLAARIVDDELTRTYQIESAVASRDDFRRAVQQRDVVVLRTFVQTIADITPMINHVAVLDPDRRVIVSVPTSPAGPTAAAAPVNAPSVSDVYLSDPNSGEKAVTVSYPIVEVERLLGAIQIRYRLEDIARWIEKVRVEPAGFVYVTDRHGYLVAYPFQVLPGQPKNVSAWPPVRAPLTEGGDVRLRFAQGHPSRPWTAAVVELKPFGWRIIAQQPDGAMLEPFYELVGSFLVMSLVLLILIGTIVLRWTNLHRTTLRLLEQQARLLRQTERRRLASTLRRPTPPPKPGAAP